MTTDVAPGDVGTPGDVRTEIFQKHYIFGVLLR